MTAASPAPEISLHPEVLTEHREPRCPEQGSEGTNTPISMVGRASRKVRLGMEGKGLLLNQDVRCRTSTLIGCFTT